MNKSVMAIFGLVVLTGAFSYGSSDSASEAFVGQYSLVAGSSVCSSDLQITVDGSNLIIDTGSVRHSLTISKSTCTEVAKTSSDTRHSDCVNVSSDSIENSRITPMPLGQNIEAKGIKFSGESRETISFYRKNTNYGSAFVLSKMLQEEPGFVCQYKRK